MTIKRGRGGNVEQAAKPDDVEQPIPLDPQENKGVWGSDAIADAIAALDIPYIAINSGSSFRGIHDSLVGRKGNRAPQLLLCIHEESAVAIVHGWGKITERAMAAFVHSKVGLMHASMGDYNAWCDRVPLLLFGATGPVDAAKRRPWIDWLHTAKDQGALVRHYVKWDDQPMSIPAVHESVLRARQIAETTPRGPTYIVFDSALQEQKLNQLTCSRFDRRHLFVESGDRGNRYLQNFLRPITAIELIT